MVVESNLIPLVLTWLGIIILLYRIIPRQTWKEGLSDSSWPKVSIVVPARDEQHNIKRVITSLQSFDYPDFEIFVVDDHSSDNTKQIAEELGAIVLSSKDLPEGWNGKTWACHQAIPKLRGDIFLFTDADTDHFPDGLKRAVSHFKNFKADMMSSFPYHLVEKWWEKLMGPFHTILMAATAPYTPRPKRLFSIGQYLMFSKVSYKNQGGHEAVKNEYPDDLGLANACLRNKGRFIIYAGRPLFQVQMYGSFLEFIGGWRRNFLAGIQQSNIWATLEVILIFIGVTGSAKLFHDWNFLIPAAIGALIIAIRQRTWGKFSILGILLMPFSLFLFCFVTFLSFYDFCTGNVLRWKGRSYTGWVTKTPQ